MRKLLLILAAIAVSFPSLAADNQVTLTPGSGVTMRTQDVGSGVQSPYNILGNTSGTSIYGTAGSANAAVLSVQGIASGTSLNVTAIGLAQGSTTSGQTGSLIMGAVTTAAPSYTNAQTSPLSLTTTGDLRTVFSNTTISTIPITAGGLSVYFVQPTASDNHVVIKAGAGQVYKVSVTNNSATVNYLRLYNATTGFNGCNSATNLIYQMAIPASTSVGGLSDSWDMGIAFATGISICVTSGYATTDTTNATASAMSVNIGYK